VVNLKVNNEIINNINLVIFDRDGTLIDLYHYWSQMIKMRAYLISEKFFLSKDDTNRIVFEMGVDQENNCLRPEGPVGIKKREIVMQAAVDYLEAKGYKKAYEVCLDCFKDIDVQTENKLDGLIKPINGMLSLIDSLHSKSCKLAIATTDKTSRAELSMDYLKLTDKFACIIGCDAVDNPKPASDMIDYITKKLNIKKEESVMIGDAITDIKMGDNAKVKASIAVSSGITPKEQLGALTKFLIDDVSKIEVF